MHTKVLRNEGLLKEFQIVLPADDIQKKADDKVMALAPTLKLPGFRPGKVPLRLVKDRYEAQVHQDVIEELVNDSIDKLLKEQNLKPALSPTYKADAYDAGKDFVFTLTVETLPEVKTLDFKELQLTRYKISRHEETLTKRLQAFADVRAEFSPVEESRPLKEGDVAIIDFEGFLNDKAFPGGTAKNYELEIGSNRFIPGFEAGLVGMKRGEKRSIDLVFPAEYGEETLAGKDVRFDVTLHDIQEKIVPPLDDAFAKEYGFDSFAAFQKLVEDRVEKEFASETKKFMRYDLFDFLDNKCAFDLPQGLVSLELDAICRELEREAPEVSEEEQGTRTEKWRTDYDTIAKRRVRLGLLLADLGQKYNLTVSPKELQEEVTRVARSYPGQEQQVITFYKNNRDALVKLQAPLLEEKVIDFIVGQANVTETEISLEAFREMVDSKEKETEERF